MRGGRKDEGGGGGGGLSAFVDEADARGGRRLKAWRWVATGRDGAAYSYQTRRLWP